MRWHIIFGTLFLVLLLFMYLRLNPGIMILFLVAAATAWADERRKLKRK